MAKARIAVVGLGNCASALFWILVWIGSQKQRCCSVCCKRGLWKTTVC